MSTSRRFLNQIGQNLPDLVNKYWWTLQTDFFISVFRFLVKSVPAINSETKMLLIWNLDQRLSRTKKFGSVANSGSDDSDVMMQFYSGFYWIKRPRGYRRFQNERIQIIITYINTFLANVPVLYPLLWPLYHFMSPILFFTP